MALDLMSKDLKFPKKNKIIFTEFNKLNASKPNAF
jgi:hypothetical protein